MIIDLADIRACVDLMHQINEAPLESITVLDGGIEQKLDPTEVVEWKYVGLSNWYFLKDKFLFTSMT